MEAAGHELSAHVDNYRIKINTPEYNESEKKPYFLSKQKENQSIKKELYRVGVRSCSRVVLVRVLLDAVIYLVARGRRAEPKKSMI